MTLKLYTIEGAPADQNRDIAAVLQAMHDALAEHHAEGEAAQLKAALDEAEARGFVLAPLVLTKAMVAAGAPIVDRPLYGMDTIWTAMIETRPQATIVLST